MVTADDELTRRSVKLGGNNYDYVEVEDGLKAGDRVVTSDMKKYANYKSVKLK